MARTVSKIAVAGVVAAGMARAAAGLRQEWRFAGIGFGDPTEAGGPIDASDTRSDAKSGTRDRAIETVANNVKHWNFGPRRSMKGRAPDVADVITLPGRNAAADLLEIERRLAKAQERLRLNTTVVPADGMASNSTAQNEKLPRRSAR